MSARCECLVCRAAGAALAAEEAARAAGLLPPPEVSANPYDWHGKSGPPAGEYLVRPGEPVPAVIPHGTLTHSPLSEAELWRLRFTALVARVAGVCTEDGGVLSCEGGDRSGAVRLGWAELEAARELTLITWPMVEASVDYTVYRSPDVRRSA